MILRRSPAPGLSRIAAILFVVRGEPGLEGLLDLRRLDVRKGGASKGGGQGWKKGFSGGGGGHRGRPLSAGAGHCPCMWPCRGRLRRGVRCRDGIPDARAFVRANTALLPVPTRRSWCSTSPTRPTALWQKTRRSWPEIGLPPPFWAFAWAGGQALARFVLDHPEVVAGRRVLDFAAGSGLVAIAAARAGAARVEAADIDPFARGHALNAPRTGW